MRFPHRVVAIGLLILSTQSLNGQTQSSRAQYVPGEVLIQFEDGTTATDRAEARSWAGAARRKLLRKAAGELEVARIQGRSVEEAIAILRRHPRVRLAEPNWIIRAHETPNDPLYTNANMWGMYGDTTTPANQFGSQAAEAWEAGNVGSDSIAVAVLDTGVLMTHPDLAPNIWTNRIEALGETGVDDDQNGFVDDLHGWDFVGNDNDPIDDNGHGTHVAGTIGAVGNNGQGVAGVNWKVALIPVKILNASGSGSFDQAIAAIDYVTELKRRHGRRIVATNNSYGAPVEDDTTALTEAIVRGANAGIVFVAAAGNENNNNDANPQLPAGVSTVGGASYEAVISVAAITRIGAKASFSNYGAVTVDLGAPGDNILSTFTNPGGYASLAGTSMAAPHVTGAVALYASLNPHASGRKLRDVVMQSAIDTPTPSLNGKTTTGGRLNLGLFAGPAPAAPGAPANLSASAISTHQIDLDWDDVTANEDAFKIERCQGSGCADFVELAVVDYPGYSDQGLPSGTTFRYRVHAFNRGGASDYSNVADAATLVPLPPSTDAGDDVTVNEGDSVALDGSRSAHPQNLPLTFTWEQIGGPIVVLTAADSSAPTFTAPQVSPAGATLTFALTATADGVTATDSVNVIVRNVNIAPNLTSVAPDAATEDVPYSYAASASDDDGPLTWSLAPSHTCGGSIDAGTGIFTFTPAGPVPSSSCIVSVQVCDGGTPGLCDEDAATIVIAAINDAPSITVPGNITVGPTNSAGTAVSYSAGGFDPEDGALTPSCSTPSGSTFPIGVTTVTCAVTDSGGTTVTGSFTVTVTDPATPGEMHGGGFIRTDDARYQFTFQVRERDNERAHLIVRVDEHGKKKGKKRDDRFTSASVAHVRFNGPAVLFEGIGEWNGVGGYRYEVSARDGGDGHPHDSLHVTIRDAAGAIVASVAGVLDGGNIQSRR